jgi:hypothetical protein
MDIGFLFGYRLSNILEKGRKMIPMSGNRKKKYLPSGFGKKSKSFYSSKRERFTNYVLIYVAGLKRGKI